MTSNHINIWSKEIHVNFKTDLSLRCWSDSIWTKANSGGIYIAAQSSYAKTIAKNVSSSEHSRFESLNLKAWRAVFWWLPDVWKQSICISSRALGKSQRCLLASPNCVYGDAFVVERQQPKQMQMKSSFHAYRHSFWWQKLLHHMFLKKSCI